MILSDIQKYIEKQGQASLADIVLHFDAEPEAVRGMLNIWIRKGKILQQKATPSCGSSCSECDTTSTEIYISVSNGIPLNKPILK